MSHSLPSASPIEAPLLQSAVESEDPLYSLLFNQSPLGVGVVEWLGDDLRYLAVNPATASRLGCAMREARGRRGRELGVPAEACAQLARLAEEALRRGGPAQLEWEVKSQRGLRSFRTTATPLPFPAGGPPRFAYMTEELTRLRRLETRLGGPDGPTSLAADVEQPLSQALHVLSIASDEVDTVAACHPEVELEDAAAALRDGIRHAGRAHHKLREMLWG